MFRRLLSPALVFALVFLGLPIGGTPAAAVSPDLVISQVYGAGGNAGASGGPAAVLNADYVEIFNRGTVAVQLGGLSIQYASATGTGNFGTSAQITELPAFALAAGQYYLVKEASGGTNGAAFTADHTDPTPINLSGSAGKIALVTGTTSLGCNGSTLQPCPPAALARIIDLIGYGGANYYEGAGAAPTLSNTTSAFRAANGCLDTDHNNADFVTGTPAPRDSSVIRPCAGDAAPTIAATTPVAGAGGVSRASNITVTFSEPVTVSDSWFSISCGTSGSHAATVTGSGAVYTLDPTADFAAGENCSVTVLAAHVIDQDGSDPPDNMAGDATWSFTTENTDQCGDAATLISKVQGSGTATTMSGAVTVEGVVVGDYQGFGQFGGYYLQEEDGDSDGDPATSEGIFVSNTSVAVAVGDRVRVTGSAGESSGLTRLSSVTRTLICPTAGTVTPTTITLPVPSMSAFERYEGMLVSFTQTLTATETFNLGRFGEVRLSANGRLRTPTAVTTPGAAAIAQADLNQRSSFVLDDGDNRQNIDPTIHPVGGLSATNTLRSGYTVDGLTGVFDFRFGSYRVQPLGPVPFNATNPRPAAPPAVGGNVKVGSFNVLNFFNGDGQGGGFPTSRGAHTAFELQRQLAKEVSALRAVDADIVGLMEIENDSDPYSALADLVAALNQAMGAGTYSYIDTGRIGSDDIKVALIYKSARVSPVGAWKIIDSSVDPRFIDTKSRPSLAQTFELSSNGERLTVVVSHLKSKSSACTDVGDPDLGDGQGNCNRTRQQAAAAIVDWLETDPTGSGDTDFLLIGDMNAYTFEDPIRTFEEAGFVNLARRFGGLDAYSYVFNGEAGYLDHALASPALAAQATGTVDWHINADEPIVLDYNTDLSASGAPLKTANQVNTLYAPDAYRSSDHDPVVIGLFLDQTKPTITGEATTSPNASGWHSGDVTIRFTCDDNTEVASCSPDAVLTAEAAGQSATGTAIDTAGNTATATVSGINIDKTAPAVAFVGNPGTYNVTQTISITCTATDALSGIATQDCPTVSAPAYTFSIGSHQLDATATDKAGNTATATTTFIVTADATTLCALTRVFVTNTGVENALCQKLDAAAAATARGDAAAARGILDAYVNELNAHRGRWITDADAEILIAIVQTL